MSATAAVIDTGPGVLDFELPEALVATEPPEARGLARDQVRLMVSDRGGTDGAGATDAEPGGIAHATARDLPRFLAAGDLLVVNTSATLPAALPVGDRMIHLSTRLPGGLWLVEVRRRAGEGSLRLHGGGTQGERIGLPGGAWVRLLSPFPTGIDPASTRLWLATLDLPDELHAYLARHGRPIRYGANAGAWPLAAYQTPYATERGSAEMPSAGRALTPELLTALMVRGVGVTPVVLHTGVSSPEDGEPPYPEPYRVPVETAARVNAARAAGRRVVAVGTTVTRALETVADADGMVHPGSGWTDLVITRERGVRAVDGLLSGWHDPRASHLALLEAVAGQRERLARCYEAALAHSYRWHEFGDLLLLL
jgi:S-adenosylmethionine:tRNA ribosyltransferase-isomerase